MSPARRRRRRWLPVTVLVVLAAAVVVTLLVRRETTEAARDASAGSATTTSTTTGAPATGSARAAATQSSASRLPYTLKPEPTSVATDSPRPSGAPIEVVMTYVGYQSSAHTVQANGFVNGVIKDGQICTLTLTRGNDRISATSTSIADATTTSCGLLQTSPGVPSGTWQAVLGYAGVDSAPVEVTVP